MCRWSSVPSAVFEMMATQPEHKENLWKVASALQKGLREAGFDIGDTNSCVTPVFLKGGLGEATNLTFDLRENYGIFCSIVVYPVVPKDVIMLRLIPTAVHTLEDVQYTIDTFKKVQEKLQAGEYVGEGHRRPGLIRARAFVRCFIDLSYDGTAYHGWQRQPASISVQQVLEEKLSDLLGRETPVLGCGRTDTGVHASAFYAHFEWPKNWSPVCQLGTGCLEAQRHVAPGHRGPPHLRGERGGPRPLQCRRTPTPIGCTPKGPLPRRAQCPRLP